MKFFQKLTEKISRWNCFQFIYSWKPNNDENSKCLFNFFLSIWSPTHFIKYFIQIERGQI